jgi:hypothetical protein
MGVLMKKAAVIAFPLMFLLVSSALSAQVAWSTGSLDEALAKARAQGKLLLLDFFAPSG